MFHGVEKDDAESRITICRTDQASRPRIRTESKNNALQLRLQHDRATHNRRHESTKNSRGVEEKKRFMKSRVEKEKKSIFRTVEQLYRCIHHRRLSPDRVFPRRRRDESTKNSRSTDGFYMTEFRFRQLDEVGAEDRSTFDGRRCPRRTVNQKSHFASRAVPARHDRSEDRRTRCLSFGLLNESADHPRCLAAAARRSLEEPFSAATRGHRGTQ